MSLSVCVLQIQSNKQRKMQLQSYLLQTHTLETYICITIIEKAAN